jgi:DNA gyrase inhibitor GyrI
MQKEGEMRSIIEDMKKTSMDTVAEKLNLETYLKRNMEDMKQEHEMRIEELKNEFEEYK